MEESCCDATDYVFEDGDDMAHEPVLSVGNKNDMRGKQRVMQSP
jgi:hypothetical protein